jgi:branched-chain amino acid transport system ATP-binding protein
LLTLEGVDAFYGDLQALHGVSLQVRAGELVALVGANAAGKTTTLRVISGTLPAGGGHVLVDGQDLAAIPAHLRVGLGIVQVPEGRRLFPFMTVRENLLLGAHGVRGRGADGGPTATLEEIYNLFSILRDRSGQLAGTLSGGEQQMLAIGRALMARPRLLAIDEPSLGVAPLMIKRIYETIANLKRRGLTILLVEQNARVALRVADRGYVVETGQIVLEGTSRELADNPEVQRAYLGKEYRRIDEGENDEPDQPV